jgi:ribosome-associated protein
MPEITPALHIPDGELSWSFARSGGPGGQNVNKVASKAVLRWDLAANTSIPDDVKQRLRAQQKRRITTEGEMVISSDRFRDQEKNRQDCLEKLREALIQALHRPKPRKATKPTKGSRERRLQAKKNSGRNANRCAGGRAIISRRLRRSNRHRYAASGFDFGRRRNRRFAPSRYTAAPISSACAVIFSHSVRGGMSHSCTRSPTATASVCPLGAKQGAPNSGPSRILWRVATS